MDIIVHMRTTVIFVYIENKLFVKLTNNLASPIPSKLLNLRNWLSYDLCRNLSQHFWIAANIHWPTNRVMCFDLSQRAPVIRNSILRLIALQFRINPFNRIAKLQFYSSELYLPQKISRADAVIQ
ncbi:hypothetical protein M529_04815 [Sphingobium ummariense RL-3]|uniref:Uncharacterized protein n=1 Tax=Sphingobium ummariense RL-3 TaxID=1346791 RepID=T0J963_9SPHN|nr:hypothetical protein M529_04815 [Sphingobium ummariense RL-3]